MNQAGNSADCCQDTLGQRLSFLLAVFLLSTVQLQAFASTADTMTASSNSPSPSTANNATLAWAATVSWLEQSMNRSVDPCEDFYMYSCGNCHHIKRPEGGDELQNTMLLRLKGLLENTDHAATEAKYIRNTKNLYQSCVNEEKLTELGTGPLLELVEKLGPWPLTSNGSSSGAQDLETTLVNLAYVGVRPFFELRVGNDIHNNSRLVIWLYEGTLSIPQQYLLMPRNSTEMVTYELFYLSLAEHVLGLPPSSALNQSIREVLDFQVELAKIHPTTANESSSSTSSEEEDPEEGKVVLADMDTLLPNFDGMRYLTTFFQGANVSLSSNTLIIMNGPYVFNLTDLVDRTDNRVVMNFLLMRLLRSHYQYLDKNTRNLDRHLRRVIYGVNSTKTWKTCVKMITDTMHEAIGTLYVREYFSSALKENATKFVEFIRNSMKEVIESAEWIDNPTKTKALEKADAIIANVGYPEYFLNDAVMERGHQNVHFDPKAYFQNVLEIYHTRVVNNANGLHRPPQSKGVWEVPPTDINAYYKAQTNVMTFPAAIFQPPFYGPNVTDSQMFGRLGVMAGHEMTHAFDDEGRQFNKDGNLEAWWSNESIANFNNLSECFVKQYSQHSISGVPLDGTKTLSENIADNGGIKIAFQAFKTWQALFGEQPTLPDANLTHDQIFFISMAQMWCNVETHEQAKTNVMTSEHSPDNVRTVQLVSNSKEFAKAFNCSVGSKMNPKAKCQLW